MHFQKLESRKGFLTACVCSKLHTRNISSRCWFDVTFLLLCKFSLSVTVLRSISSTWVHHSFKYRSSAFTVAYIHMGARPGMSGTVHHHFYLWKLRHVYTEHRNYLPQHWGTHDGRWSSVHVWSEDRCVRKYSRRHDKYSSCKLKMYVTAWLLMSM